MRTSSLVASLALLLPLVASKAAPEPKPCSDHPGVVHKPGEYDIPIVGSGASSQANAKPKSKTVKLKVEGDDDTPKPAAAAPAKSQPKANDSAEKPKNKSKGSSSSDRPAGIPFKPKKSDKEKKKKVPKVEKPSKSSLSTGAQDAVNEFAASDLLPKNVSNSLGEALNKAINDQLAVNATKTITSQTTLVTQIVNSTATGSLALNGTNATANATATQAPSPIYITITQNVTQTVTTDLASSSAVSSAAINVKAAIDSAFAAVDLAQSGLDEQTTKALEACLQTVLSNGGLPDGYACLTASGSNAAGLESTLNTVLEQFQGILPNIILEQVFGAVTPSLTALLPSNERVLIDQIEASIKSVIATLSGYSVTALNQAQKCYTQAIQLQGNTSYLACYQNSTASTLATATNGVLESFVGVLPASLVTTVQNIINYNLASSSTPSDDLAGKVHAQISNALNSAASTLSGNTVSLAETLQACTSLLLTNGNATAAQECIAKGNAPTLSMTMVLGIAEQFDGYLPSSFFSNLVEEARPLLANYTTNPTNASEVTINGAFDSYFNNATAKYGPAYVTCIEQVGRCVTNAVRDTGKLSAVCPGPVKGCESVKARKRSFITKRHFGDTGVSGFLRRRKNRIA